MENLELLDYHKKILQSVSSEDNLTVISPGLGLETILLSLLYIELSSKSLVFVLNSEKEDQEYFLSNLADSKNLKVINGKTSPKRRRQCYYETGVVFIPTRYFIYDILVRKVPVSFVGGLIIFKAHLVLDDSHLQFILHHFRSLNPKAFIKAFSDSPVLISREFGKISRVLKALGLHQLSLWPRFHSCVSSVLNSQDIDVVEIGVQLTKIQKLIQTALLDLIAKCGQNFIKNAPELKLNSENFNVDKILSNDIFRELFDSLPVINPGARVILEDIKVLKRLMYHLTNMDAFGFHEKLEQLKELYKNNFLSPQSSCPAGGWLLTDHGDTILVQSTQRLAYISSKLDRTSDPLHSKILEELSPKWKALAEIFDEVANTEMPYFKTEEKFRVLILSHSKTRLLSFFRFKNNPEKFIELMLKRRLTDDDLIEFIDPSQEDSSQVELMANCSLKFSKMSDKVDYSLVTTSSHYSILNVLKTFQPHVVVMFDVFLEGVRLLEVAKAQQSASFLRVYMIFHKDSIEEKIYLTSIEAETLAFETLIKEKGVIAIPDQDSNQTDKNINLPEDSRVVEGYHGCIVVDIREFVAKLPLVLYKVGFDVKPVTLEIGDYIISQDIGIERKSVSDLMSSLKSGRMYAQAQALIRYYKMPFLLIEFENETAFLSGLSSTRKIGSFEAERSSSIRQSILLSLLVSCPSLRLMWSTSPEYSAKIFSEFKKDRQEPDAAMAASITSDEETETDYLETNKTYDMLLKLPFVTRTEVNRIAKKVNDFYELLHISKKELMELSANGDKLYDFFNTEIL